MESLNSTLARNSENGVQRSQWKQLLAELFCMVSLNNCFISTPNVNTVNCTVKVLYFILVFIFMTNFRTLGLAGGREGGGREGGGGFIPLTEMVVDNALH